MTDILLTIIELDGKFLQRTSEGNFVFCKVEDESAQKEIVKVKEADVLKALGAPPKPGDSLIAQSLLEMPRMRQAYNITKGV